MATLRSTHVQLIVKSGGIEPVRVCRGQAAGNQEHQQVTLQPGTSHPRPGQQYSLQKLKADLPPSKLSGWQQQDSDVCQHESSPVSLPANLVFPAVRHKSEPMQEQPN